MGSLELISWICRSTYLHIFISDDNLNGLIACLLLWVQDRMIVSKNWPGKSCSCWVFVLQTLPPRILLSTWFWSCLPPGMPYWFIRFKTGWWFDRPTPATQNRNEKSIRYRFQVKTQHFNKRKLSSWSIVAVVVSEKRTDAILPSFWFQPDPGGALHRRGLGRFAAARVLQRYRPGAEKQIFWLDGLNVRFPVAVSNYIQFEHAQIVCEVRVSSSLYHCVWTVNDSDVSSPAPTHTYFVHFCSGSSVLNNYPAKLWMNRMSWHTFVHVSSRNTLTPSTLKFKTIRSENGISPYGAVQWLYGCVQFQILWPTLSIWHRSCWPLLATDMDQSWSVWRVPASKTNLTSGDNSIAAVAPRKHDLFGKSFAWFFAQKSPYPITLPMLRCCAPGHGGSDITRGLCKACSELRQDAGIFNLLWICPIGNYVLCNYSWLCQGSFFLRTYALSADYISYR